LASPLCPRLLEEALGMPKQRVKAAAGNTGGDSGVKSDEEILQHRKRLDAFDTADTYLLTLGLGFWALALLWLVYFSDSANAGWSLHDGAADVCLVLVVSGSFCRGISAASPRLWSSWRFAFHLAWCPVLGSMAFISGLRALQGSFGAISSSVCWCLSLCCAVMAFGAVATFPGSSLGSAKAVISPVASLLFIIDGVSGMALAVSVIMGAAWAQNLGPLTAFMTALPLGMIAAGLALCKTEAELLVAAPCAILFCILASLRTCYFSGFVAAVPTIVLMFAKFALYLPLPVGEEEENIFYMSLCRFARACHKIMSQPVGGFGDEGEGG